MKTNNDFKKEFLIKRNKEYKDKINSYLYTSIGQIIKDNKKLINKK